MDINRIVETVEEFDGDGKVIKRTTKETFYSATPSPIYPIVPQRPYGTDWWCHPLYTTSTTVDIVDCLKGNTPNV